MGLKASGGDPFRMEDEGARAEGGAFHAGPSDRGRRLHRFEMLRPEPGLAASGPNPGDTHRLARDKRQAERAPQDLPAAFSSGSVDLNHRVLPMSGPCRMRPDVRVSAPPPGR